MAADGLDVVTGAFSYTGRYIAQRLLDAGRRVRTLTNHPERPSPFGDRVLALPYRFDDPAALAGSLEGAETLYNTYWIRFARGRLTHERAVEHTRALFSAAEAAGVRRIVHVSITNASSASPLPYFRGKGLAEEALRSGRAGWGIVRPALIFGPEDVLVHNIAWFLRRLPVFAVFGSGLYPVQPVHVEDLADLAVRAGGAAENLVVDAVGPETYTYLGLVKAVAAALDRDPPILHLPPVPAWLLGAGVGALVHDVVVTRDEIAGLMAGLLVSDGPPTCGRRLGEWLSENASALGARWSSETGRHYS